jgi:hypothetical protein
MYHQRTITLLLGTSPDFGITSERKGNEKARSIAQQNPEIKIAQILINGKS